MYQRSQLMDLESHQAGPSKGKERGRRVIVAAVLTEDGVLPDSELLLVSGVREEDQAADYHKEMDGDNFEKYYMSVIPLLAEAAKKKGRPAVFICDNAPYHNKAIKKPPISNSSKAEVRSFLTEQGISLIRKTETFSLIWQKILSSPTVAAICSQSINFLNITVSSMQSNFYGLNSSNISERRETHWIVRDRALRFLRAFSAQSAAKLLDHPRKLVQDVREMTLERNLTLEDDDFELLYDIDEDGNLVNIHIGSDEEEDWGSEEFDGGEDFGEYEDDDFQYNDEDSLHSDFEMLDDEELEI
ncbi:hypothetical protein CRE_10636 [Caenorhabditis remanei]|uniref:Tc1-like transposase DDE domain-containing protein n=1 Tax=Caenorhabditis remanei TaxID=31234 RepID=E3NER7_CAERE|nr:hypothetical protein CRE_10636 [Caenorhabditis remanei]